jgi:hypothetical protein
LKLLKSCYNSGSLPCLYWYEVCYCLRSYQPGSVLNTHLNTTCKSTYTDQHWSQHANCRLVEKSFVTHNAVLPTYICRDCFGHILSTKSVCVIPFSNHDWKQTTSLYHAIYITACEGICSCLSVFGFATCITSPCTLVAKRVEVVPCYTCCCYYYYYVNAVFSSPCFFCILCVMTTERSF